jgi:hypothetical protein
MALPAHLAERFSPALARALRTGAAPGLAKANGLAFGEARLDAILPDGGLPRGAVVELSVGEGVPATSLVLAACSTLQRTHEKQGRELPWCAFVDPSATLYAPGVSEAGVRPERLLVVRPPLEALSRTVLRLAKSPAFALVIVDALGVPGARLRVLLDAWPRLVRRLAMEVEGTERSIVLVTDRSAPRAMPLPVAQRIEITRPAQDRLLVQVPKDRHGQVTPIRPVLWTGLRRPEVEAAEGAVQHATAS